MPNVFGARTGIALVALGLLIAANALIGPLALGVVRFHVSQTAENQLIGGEVVSLVVAAPLAVIAGVLWRRSNRLAPSLALGAALYALYMYVQYVVGPQYERYVGNNEYFFPLHLVLIILAWATGLRAWHALSAMRMPTIAIGTRRLLAALLLVLNATFALAWLSSVLAVLTGPHTSSAWLEYQKDQTLFWLIRMMDLAFVIPASFLVAVGLLRGVEWATRLAYAFLGFQTLIVSAVAGMAIMMAARADPAANPVLLVVTVVLALGLTALYVLLLRRLIPATVNLT